jgi:hypothetical protein
MQNQELTDRTRSAARSRLDGPQIKQILKNSRRSFTSEMKAVYGVPGTRPITFMSGIVWLIRNRIAGSTLIAHAVHLAAAAEPSYMP